MQTKSALDAFDYRHHAPMFEDGNFENNLTLVTEISKLSSELGITNGQLALAWLYYQADHISATLGRGKCLQVIPIPGTTSIAHLHENLKAREVVLSQDALLKINELLSVFQVRGNRYAHMGLTFHGNL